MKIILLIEKNLGFCIVDDFVQKLIREKVKASALESI